VPNIDLGTILQNAVPFGYGDLVTRPTGRAVRSSVEAMLPRHDDGKTTVIDFSAVRCLDISCADEIVGKLLLQYGQGQHFVLRGVSEAHRESLDLVLERHGVAVVAQGRDGALQVLGPVGEPVKAAFGAVLQSGCSAASEVADRLSLPMEAALPLLDELLTRRLVTQKADQFRALSA
jgi:hypothetical protein